MAGERGLYEKVLEAAGARGELLEERAVRASAGIVPWRRGPRGELEVFWVQRARTMPFMGGWHAFPGGGLSGRDASVPVEGEPRGVDAGPEDGAMPEALREEGLGPLLRPGLVACALRELFEELGLLPFHGAAPCAEELADARRSLLERQEDLPAILTRLDLVPDASRLVYAGRWLTPPLGPLRFDNRFFLLCWEPDEPTQPRILPGELVSGEWIRPASALQRWERGVLLAAPPIIHILRVMMEEGPEEGLERLRRPVEANLGPVRKVEFSPGVLLFPMRTATLPPATHTNAYVLGFGDAVLVDPGSAREDAVQRLLQALEATRNRLERRVSAIWLTHHHPDHVGGVEPVRSALGVPVLAHPETARRLEARGLEVDGTLVDGQRITLAGARPMTLRILHTPGHARGHLCFLHEEVDALVAGDMVAGFGTIVIDPPEGCMEDYLRSLKRLEALAPTVLHPSHGPAIFDGRAKLREYREHRLWREERIRAAWEAGLRGPAAMLDRVYDELAPEARPLAERQIQAHLEHLGLTRT